MISTEVNFSQKSVGKAVRKIEECLARYSDMRVDEIESSGGAKAKSAFSQRKAHRGKRVRAEGCEWVQVMGEHRRSNNDSRRRQNERNTLKNIKAIAHRYCLVRTDGWRGNRHVDSLYAHQVVIHKKNFVSEEGIHTNAVECGMLGSESDDRKNRVKALCQVVNAKLHEKDEFCEILCMLKRVCCAGQTI